MPFTTTDPLYELAMFPPFMLNKLAEFLSSQGIDCERLCRGLGFRRDDLYDPDIRVSYRQADTMIKRGLEALPDYPGLGLAVGNLNVLGTLGLVGHAAALSKNLQDAWEICSRYQTLTGGMTQSQTTIADGVVYAQTLCRLPELPVQILCIEEVFASIVVYLRELGGEEINPIKVELAYPAPAYTDRYSQIFQAPVEFNSEGNRLMIDAAVLDKELPGHDPVALKQILAILERELKNTTATLDLAASVERVIIDSLQQRPTMAGVAVRMAMSERTLRRRLADNGLSFEQLVDNARRLTAMNLIHNNDMAIERVAELCGYGDSRSFRRAFRRWVSVGPREFRRG
ncbi:AraC family transcriptional regulator [Spongiibacter nanhainus]|uniref:AraC family transcriptional regulator n=1 Tax=Spongiibacter nanhainus TaxID=2794344 RepID=A0A7T4QYR3_9GAMM|nr:AraC family transcriptional regulator [Spongiibacter nanhainus]QQD17263.1 AraC family transcriptional regulator [Spongiibacter nanhainus]